MNLSQAMQPAGPSSYIVDVVDTGEIIKEFLKSYYKSKLSEIRRLYPHEKILQVRYSDIVAYHALFELLENSFMSRPEWAINEIRRAARDLLMKGGEKPDIIIHITNISPKIRIRDIREPNIGTLISVEGIIRKISEVRPRMLVAQFRCSHGHEFPSLQKYGHLKRPDSCPVDGCTSRRFDLNERKSTYIDSQRLRLQESPEGLRGGQQPQDIEVDLTNELCGIVTPGDRITINGIVRTHPKFVKGGESSTFDIYLHAVSIEVSETEYTQIEISDEDETLIQELSQDPDIHTRIASSIAPSIWGHTDLKMAFAFQLFGGVARELEDKSTLRGDVHVLLVGDPGIAKSQMMQYVSRIAPRSIYTSGQSSSKAGLTAAAVRDETDGRWTLEAGALVLADMGICIVDEIDKMGKGDRDSLHEAMEQQTISVAKAGLQATLHSRCALLAAANPKYGRFDPFTSLGDQVDLPPSLLSRFDLIFVLSDIPNKEDDEAIARQITKNRSENPSGYSHIDPMLLKKYIAVAKQIRPGITDKAKELVIRYYVDLRSLAAGSQNAAVPVTARQIEGIIRLAEASARIRLSAAADEQDAQRAIQMVDQCFRKIAYDAKTNTWDIDGVATGKKKSERDMERIILSKHRDLKPKLFKVSREDLINSVADTTKWDKGTISDRLETMIRAGVFFLPDNKHLEEV